MITASDFLAQCGLPINATKSFTVSIRNVPQEVRRGLQNSITCLGQTLPALSRESQWKYLEVPFTLKSTFVKPEKQLEDALEIITKAPLKPEQKIFALRVIVQPSLYHLLILGNTNLSRLKKIDSLTRSAVKKKD
ncbi:hypothetical protein QLX08_005894 [Tetragonisca angustula]|uniref:Uncharacterized protein n=1 Tax=Tetragonisca angustula TaxID=166442 RepID=A0AAW0ZWD1_9HYME